MPIYLHNSVGRGSNRFIKSFTFQSVRLVSDPRQTVTDWSRNALASQKRLRHLGLQDSLDATIYPSINIAPTRRLLFSALFKNNFNINPSFNPSLNFHTNPRLNPNPTLIRFSPNFNPNSRPTKITLAVTLFVFWLAVF